MNYNNINVNVSGPVQPTSTYKTKVLKGNNSFASQVTEPNTKYVIKYDFDLEGENVTIPDVCILEFDGGSLNNGTVNCNNTSVVGNKYGNAAFEGTWVDKRFDTLREDTDNLQTEVNQLKEDVGSGGSVDQRIDEERQRAIQAENDRYTKSETYNKTELNSMITTPNQEFVTLVAESGDTLSDIFDGVTGAADTTYRVGNWDGSANSGAGGYDVTVYSEYAYNGTNFVHLSTKTQIGEAFDISAYHATGGEFATYADLSAALDSNNNGGVPQSLQKGGMSIKFVQTDDNKYVQYRYMGTATTGSPNPFLDTVNWQGVTSEVKAGSTDLVESGGVIDNLASLKTASHRLPLSVVVGEGIQSANGYPYVNTKRARTNYLISENAIVVGSDYEIISIAEYDKDYEFIKGTSFENTDKPVQSYTTDTDAIYVRYGFKRIDNADIASSEADSIVDRYTDLRVDLPKYYDTIIASSGIQFNEDGVYIENIILIDEARGSKTIEVNQQFTIENIAASYRLKLNVKDETIRFESSQRLNRFDVLLLSYNGNLRTWVGGCLYPYFVNHVFKTNETAYNSKFAELSEIETLDATKLANSIAITESHPVDKTISGRNVNYKTGEYATSSTTYNYANEIALDGTESMIQYYSVKYNGDYGYAFMKEVPDPENEGEYIDEYVYGGKIDSAVNVIKVIPYNIIRYALRNGATKVRLSLYGGTAAPNEYYISKIVNSKVNDIDNRLAVVENNFAAYDFVGSPKSFTPNMSIEGLSVFSTLQSLYDAFDALVTAHPKYFKREADIGMDESNTYPIRHYSLRFQYPLVTNDRAGLELNLWSDTQFKYRHIIVNMGTHCDEKWAMLAGYLSIKDILESNDDWAMFIKNNFVIDIVPCLSPWSAANGWTSKNVNDININRTFFTNHQAENLAMINLINELIPKGLVGVVDYHNTGLGDGYLIAKPTYWAYKYYCVLAQKISSFIDDKAKDVFANSTNDNYFHVWTSEGTEGQLHQYVNSLGLLGATHEIAIGGGSYNPYPDGNRMYGVPLQEMVGIAIITAFATYGMKN